MGGMRWCQPRLDPELSTLSQTAWALSPPQ
jgi:hypothetical protein